MKLLSRVPLLLITLISFNVHAAKTKLKKVFTAKATKVKVAKSVFYPALIMSKTYSSIEGQLDGIVEEILVSLGQKVKKGQKILRVRKQELGLSFNSHFLVSPVDGIVSDIKVVKGLSIKKRFQISLYYRSK